MSLTSLGFTKPALAQNPPILISEVQTGFIDSSGTEFPKQEFIELTNVSGGWLNMTDWRLEYLSAAHDGSGVPTSTLVSFTGRLPAGGKALFSYTGYLSGFMDRGFGEGSTASSGLLAKSGGHVRLTDGISTIDCVAWGSASVIEGCDKVVPLATASQSIQRPLSESGSYDKLLGVKNLAPPSPQGGELYDLLPQEPPVDPPTEPEPEVPVSKCENVILTELLPNPAGDDAAGEFIELHNTSNKDQTLAGCVLRIGTAGKQYALPADAKLLSGEYKAFYFSTTALGLTNSGGEVWLLSDQAPQSAAYPTLGDDQAWALINGLWQVTDVPTPGAPNVLPDPGEIVTSTESTEPCPTGKFRNPETGRCKNIESDNELTPCSAGQERNPDTGRCRKVTTASATLASCGPGEERNATTNRCRKVTTTQTSVKACEAGQERNPETNRCRKVAAASSGASGPDGNGSNMTQNYRILLIVLLLVLAYAIYEYRQEITKGVSTLRTKLQRKA